MKKEVARVNLTFEFDSQKVSRGEIVDRLDALLVENFEDVEDWNARWYVRAEESPLFGAGKTEEGDA